MRFITLHSEDRVIKLNAAAFESVQNCTEDDLEDFEDKCEIRTRGGNYIYVTETIDEVIALVTNATQRN